MVLIPVPIRCLFGSYLDWNLVGRKCHEERRRTAAAGGPDARTELTIRALVMQYRELTMYSISPTSGAKLQPRQINSRRNTGNDRTQLCVQS